MPKDTTSNMPSLVYGPPAKTGGRRRQQNQDLILEVRKLTDIIEKKADEHHQYSAAFDYFRQTSTSGPNSSVLDQLYGRNLSFLREYYRVNAPIDQIIIGKKFEQLRGLSDYVGDHPAKIGWRVVHNDNDSPDFKTTPPIKKMCRWLADLIKSPNKTRHQDYKDAFIAMLESKLLLDRIPIEKLEHIKYPGTGKPASWLIPDAATIKPTTWVLQAMSGSTGYSGMSKREGIRHAVQNSQAIAKQLAPYSPEDRARQLAAYMGTSEAYEYSRLTSGVIKWVQEMPDGQLAAGYTDNDISVYIGNPSPQINAWGWSSGSAFERSFAFGEAISKMIGYNSEIFDSRMPEGVLGVNDAGRDKLSKQQFRERMLEEGTDRYNNILVQFVGDPDKDIKYHEIKKKPTEMQFKELFMLYVKLKCSAYGFDYRMLNLEDGKSGGMAGSGAAVKQIDMQNEIGIISDTRYIAHCLTHGIIRPWTDDYRVEFVYDITDTENEIKILTQKQSYTSIAETRKAQNLDNEFWKEAPKEHWEMLKANSSFIYYPGIQSMQLVQLLTKQMDLNAQEKMAAEERSQEGKQGEEESDIPEESKEIRELRNQLNKEQLKADISKSFEITVNHEYD